MGWQDRNQNAFSGYKNLAMTAKEGGGVERSEQVMFECTRSNFIHFAKNTTIDNNNNNYINNDNNNDDDDDILFGPSH